LTCGACAVGAVVRDRYQLALRAGVESAPCLGDALEVRAISARRACSYAARGAKRPRLGLARAARTRLGAALARGARARESRLFPRGLAVSHEPDPQAGEARSMSARSRMTSSVEMARRAAGRGAARAALRRAPCSRPRRPEKPGRAARPRLVRRALLLRFASTQACLRPGAPRRRGRAGSANPGRGRTPRGEVPVLWIRSATARAAWITVPSPVSR
jgi:hypothetical protein